MVACASFAFVKFCDSHKGQEFPSPQRKMAVETSSFIKAQLPEKLKVCLSCKKIQSPWGDFNIIFISINDLKVLGCGLKMKEKEVSTIKLGPTFHECKKKNIP